MPYDQSMRSFLHVLLGLAVLTLLTGAALAGKILNDALVSNPFSHRVWQDVINSAVDSAGNVDFIKLRANPDRINEYLDQLAVVSPENRPDYFRNRSDELAYWINAHNALALRLVLDLYPIERLPEGLTFETNNRYELGGLPYSLLQIRGRLQARFPNRPEALLALTRYTLDSPPLAHLVYEGPQLPRQLEVQAVRVLLPHPASESGDCPALSPQLTDAEESFLKAAQNRWMGGQPQNWNDILRPYLPPESRARLNCHNGLRFAEPDLRLREIR